MKMIHRLFTYKGSHKVFEKRAPNHQGKGRWHSSKSTKLGSIKSCPWYFDPLCIYIYTYMYVYILLYRYTVHYINKLPEATHIAQEKGLRLIVTSGAGA